MSPVERGLRRALLGVCALTAAGLAGELALIGHTEELAQRVPFALAAAALACCAGLAWAPSVRTLGAARLCAALLVGGAGLGVWEHMKGNLAFEDELRPNATASKRVVGALTGASPLLAPGALAAAGLLLWAAAWRHPASPGAKT